MPKRNHFHGAQRRRYRAHLFQNPYFSHKPRRRLLSFALAGLAIGIAIGIASFLFTSPRFAIRAVSIEGARSVSPTDIRDVVQTYLAQRRFLLFRADNRFLFQENHLRERLEERFAFNALIIEPRVPILRVTVSEKISTFLWTSRDAIFLADVHGVTMDQLTPDEAEALAHPPAIQGPVKNGEVPIDDAPLLRLEDIAGVDVRIGQSVMSDQEVTNLLAFRDGLAAMGIVANPFVMDRSVGTWMRVGADRGYDILFDPVEDVSRQLDALAVFLGERMTELSALAYIDLRFADRVYFK
jgi:hypothetical protein